jgi:hypothetical protein
MPFTEALREWFGRHPKWVSAVFVFCAYMTFVYLPFDFLLKPLWQDMSDAQEVWFGILLTGKAAKATEPLHWLIYGALTWGFWKERTWVWPAAALYIAQIAVGGAVWSVLDERGGGVAVGAAALVLLSIPSVALWRYGRKLSSSSAS